MGTIAGIIRGHLTRYLVAAVAVVLALLLRVTLESQSITLPTYVTFYPVVFLAAILGDIWTGILATALSALLVDYFLLPPFGSFAVHSTSDIVGMSIFCFSGVLVSVVAELYRRRREKQAAYAIESAILSERGNVEEAPELTETVRAERQRFLGILESLRTTGSSAISPGVSPVDRVFSAAGRGSGFPSLDEKRFKASLRRTVLVPFIAALILAGAAFWAAFELNAAMQWVDHTDQVIGQSRRLLKLTVDMETGERGYLVTGNDVFLQPYQEASKVIDSEYQTLYLLVADDPPQQVRLERLHVNLNQWRGYAERMIALRRAGGAYTDLQANLAGKGEMDEIRGQIGEFQSVEEHIRDERNRTAHRDWRLIATICILLGLGMGVVLAVFIYRRMEMVAASFEESGRALAASEQRWATTLESIGDAVIATDNQGRVTFFNRTAAALTGWQSEEALSQPIRNVFRIIDEQTRRPAEYLIDRVLKEGRAVELANHTALLAKDGEEIPIASSAAPIQPIDGKVIGVVLSFRDVTERKRAEEFKQSSQYTRSLLEASLDPLVTISAEGKITDVNEAAIKATGVEREKLVGTDYADYFTEPEKAREGYKRVFSEGFVIDYPLTIHHADGHLTDVLYNASVYKDADSRVLGVFAAARDITAQKQASQYARSLLEASLDPLVTISAEGKITDVNEAAIKATGVAREKLVGTDFADYFTEPERAEEGYQRVFSEGFVTDYPLTIRHVNGRLTDVLYNASVYKDPQGNVLGVFAAARDVTALKQTEASLKESVAELARSNADLQQFAYVASHDMQEPLRTMSSFSQLLAQRYKGKLDADADDFIGFVVDGATRMQSLINDLLAFSRIGTRGGRFALVDCEGVLQTVKENLNAAIAESKAEITHGHLPALFADETQLAQLFQNLIVNTIKFRRPEEALRIHISCKRLDGAWQFSIRDNGIGIEPQYFERIFVIFQRLHGREEYAGTGIGLALSKKIVERHGGRIWVESDFGKGSIFHFIIPEERGPYDESSSRH
jgi:PAS domain S-box-containing protein